MDNVYFECSVLKAYNSFGINKDHPLFSIHPFHPYPMFRLVVVWIRRFKLLKYKKLDKHSF